MQRRAAAVSVAFFVLVSAASYALIATAESPEVTFENPEPELQQGDAVEVGGQQHTVSSISAEMESSGGGGHGGGGGGTLVRSGEISWTNESARYTETWDNGSTVTRDNQSYTVVVENASDPASFVLREQINRTAILLEDENAENELATYNGSEWVVINRDGEQTLVAPEEYFPEPNERQYAEGDNFPYNGQRVVVADVTSSAVTIEWTAPRENTISLAQETNVTIQDQTYLVFFPDNSTVYLTQDFESYQAQTNQIELHHEHESGLWGIIILSGIAVTMLLGMAYLPSRY
jgi:hypothetical protein